MAKQVQTLTRNAIQYETKRDFGKSQHGKQNKRLITKCKCNVVSGLQGVAMQMLMCSEFFWNIAMLTQNVLGGCYVVCN